MKKILLISGHGAGDPGATAVHDGVRYEEAVETVAAAVKTAAELADYDVKVSVYPIERDAYKDYKAGTLKLEDADLVVELHFNAIKFDRGDGIRKGTEALLAPNAVPGAKEAATKLAAAVATTLGVPNRGVKTQSLAVCWTAGAKGIPAVLLEVCFIDDGDDWTRYYLHRDDTAKAIAAAICSHLDVSRAPKNVTAGCAAWAEEDCRWAVEQGLFKGDGNGDFRWQEAVTRQELAALLHRFALTEH